MMNEETPDRKRRSDVGAQEYDHISKKLCSEQSQILHHCNSTSPRSFGACNPVQEQGLGDSNSELLTYTYPKYGTSSQDWFNQDLGRLIDDGGWHWPDLTQDATIPGINAIPTPTTQVTYWPYGLHQTPFTFSGTQSFNGQNKSDEETWLCVDQFTNDSELLMPGLATLQHTGLTPTASVTSFPHLTNSEYSWPQVHESAIVETSQFRIYEPALCENGDVPKLAEPSPASALSTQSRADLNTECQSQLHDTQYDTCFGVVSENWARMKTSANFAKITATPISSSHDSLLDKSAASKVNLIACGDIFKLYFIETNKYAGMLVLQSLSNLMAKYQAELKGYLSMAKRNTLVPEKRKGKASPHHACEYSLRIVVYGSRQDKTAVGEFLSDAGLFLQHPAGAECDLDLKYFNPHYLVRPGGEMPRIEELSLEVDDEKTGSTGVMDDVAKNRLLRMFDHADGAEAVVDVTPSPRLQTPLMK
jgi:hypothetical protein